MGGMTRGREDVMEDPNADYGKASRLLNEAADKLREAFVLLGDEGNDFKCSVDDRLDLWSMADIVDGFDFDIRKRAKQRDEI